MSTARPIRLRHAALPLIAMLADRGLDLVMSIKAGYNPETAVARWRVEIVSRYRTNPKTWVGTDVVTVDGQTLTLAALPDAASADDEDLLLSDVIGHRGQCRITLIALPEEGDDLPLWQCQGPMDFIQPGDDIETGASIGKAIPLDLGTGTTIELTILGTSEGGAATIEDIEGLQAALDAKASAASVTALSGTVDGKADSADLDALAAATTAALAGKASTESVTAVEGDVDEIQATLAETTRLDEIEDTYNDGGTVWHTLSLSVTKVAAALYSAVFRIKIGGIPFLRVLVDKIIHIHHSWTDETNYSRCEAYWDDDRGVLMFKQVAAGTGVVKGFQFEHNGDKFLNLGAGGLTYSGPVNFQYTAKFGGLLEVGKWGATPGNEYLSSGCYLACDQPGGAGTPHRLIVVFPTGSAIEIATEI